MASASDSASDSAPDELHFFDSYEEEDLNIRGVASAPPLLGARSSNTVKFVRDENIRSSLPPTVVRSRISYHQDGLNRYKTKQLLHRTKSVYQRSSSEKRREERRIRDERRKAEKEEEVRMDRFARFGTSHTFRSSHITLMTNQNYVNSSNAIRSATERPTQKPTRRGFCVSSS
jgi:hypothetical protein